MLSYPGAAAHRVVEAKGVVGKKWRNIAIVVGTIMVVAAAAIAGWQYFMRQPESVEAASLEKMKFQLPDKPSIAVLPFDNMSGDPEDEYLADGIAEDIITAISKIGQMFVIARNSTFIYKGKPVKAKQVSEEFGVQYILEGSLQRSGDRLRITAQLIDALTGHHLWAERYDRRMKDLFEVKDEITKKIITELQVEMTLGEQVRLSAKQTDSLEAWILFHKGYTYFEGPQKKEINIKAREYFERAVRQDPNFITAWALLAVTHLVDVMLDWSDNPSESFAKYYELCQKAISIDESSAWAHFLLGDIYTRQGQLEKAIAEAEKAIGLNPNNSEYYYRLAQNMHDAGQPEEAVKLIKRAMRLSPIYPARYLNQLGQTLHYAGRYEEALAAYEQFFELHKKTGEFSPVWSHFGLTATYLELGQVDNASEHFREALAIKPNYDFLGYAKSQLGYKDEDFEHFKSLFEPLRKVYADADKKKQYVHKEKPAFRFEYPEGSKKAKIDSPNEVLKMRTPRGVMFNAFVDSIPEGMTIADIGPKYYLVRLKEADLGTNFKVLSNELITLGDGTKACRTEIKWLWKDGTTWINTLLVSAYREKKLVRLTVHPWGDPKEVAWIVESLTFR